MSPGNLTKPTLWQRIRGRWNRVNDWRRRVWSDLRPGPEARKGAAWAMVASAAGAAVVGADTLHSGFGWWADAAFAFAVAAVGIPLVALIAALLLTILRRVHRFVFGIIFGCAAFIALLWQPPLGYVMGLLFVVMEGILGATIATFLFGNFRKSARSKRMVTISLFAAAVGANVALLIFLSFPGSDVDLMHFQAAGSTVTPLSAPNPSEPGPFQVKTLVYGSGADLRRPEFGKSVAIKTGTVDASLFFKDFKGWKANVRRRYWGFGMDRLPLNARVWYPAGDGPFPLALIVHGNHDMAEFSDPGYEYLGRLLASRGFILASIDENFLNSGLFHDPPKQQAVRGWMLLEHLKLWRQWNSTPGNPFYRMVDVNNVALMGHSRGGEAAATAALFNRLQYDPEDANIRFDYGYPIKSIVAIAPADGQYKPAGQWRTIDNVNYLTLQGANDADVSSFMGSRQWDHVRFTGPGPWFKAEIYIYRANHGQFNTVWGNTDLGEPMSRILDLKPLLSGEDQRRIGKTYISAFLEATLHGRREYLPMFRDHRTVRSWLPDTLYKSRYLDASYKTVADFSEDPDLTTTTLPGGRISTENLSVWHEGKIPFRHGDRDYNGAFIGWNREDDASKIPVYSIALPDGQAQKWKLGPKSVLTMSVAVTDEKALPPGRKPDDKPARKDDSKAKSESTDFTVELETDTGVTARLPLSRFGDLLPPFKVRFTKLALIDDFAYEKSSEPVFQTVDLPLAAFAAASGNFDPAKVRIIRLRFDRTVSRVVILSQIGLADAPEP